MNNICDYPVGLLTFKVEYEGVVSRLKLNPEGTRIMTVTDRSKAQRGFIQTGYALLIPSFLDDDLEDISIESYRENRKKGMLEQLVLNDSKVTISEEDIMRYIELIEYMKQREINHTDFGYERHSSEFGNIENFYVGFINFNKDPILPQLLQRGLLYTN